MSPYIPPIFCARQAAFTLLELLLVLVILGLAAAVATPSLHRMGQRTRLEGVARTLLAQIQAARIRAVEEGQVYELVIDTREHHCFLALTRAAFASGGDRTPQMLAFSPLSGTGIRSEEDVLFEALPNRQGDPVALDEHIRLSTDALLDASGCFHLTFLPDGSASASQITLTDEAGRTLAVYSRSPAEPYRVGRPIRSDAVTAEGFEGIRDEPR